jgi:hypothetical protein
MKKLLTLMWVLLITPCVFAQSPQKMSYQCVVRNESGALMTNQSIRIRISILQGTSSGTAIYTETQTPTTNANGLVSIEIGGGTGFDAINWASGPYFLKTETDPTGGTNYMITGTSELLSVPYALYSKNVATYSESDPKVKAINGIVKSNGTTISAATAGSDYLTPTGSASTLTDFPILNQNTSGSSASFTGSLAGQVTGTQSTTVITNAAVIGKVLTGYVSGAGTVAATDNILQAIQKINGNTTHSIGELYGGGIVFYVYDNGHHGLIAATQDQGNGPWTIVAYQPVVSNAVRDGINGGLSNTERIAIQAGAGSYAAQICINYKGGNYGDWYLPSKYELNLLYLQKAMVGGFNVDIYWSSTEADSHSAWYQVFTSGQQELYLKAFNWGVRPIRAF